MRAAGLSGLPGSLIVEQGLADLSKGRRTVEAWLVAIASRRLQSLGIAVARPADFSDPDLELYAELGKRERRDAYADYNALRRELASFLDALAARRRREEGRGPPARYSGGSD